ncbi:MAG TPA: histidine kinase [Pyrinomonadaceae bacterium]|nr:histidine kinase [Pyrinomonadaceae bacterium]
MAHSTKTVNQELTKKSLPVPDPLSEQWIDLRLIAGMRVVLGTLALLVVLLDPVESLHWPVPTYIALLLYSFYGLLIYHLSIRRNPLVAHKLIPWLDLVWYLPLIAFTSDTTTIFYYFFFFSIIVASFSWGLGDGLRLTLASATLYTIVGVLTAPKDSQIDLNHLLLAPIGLLIFGYIIARWGGYHTQLKNRLKLLKDVTVFSNPRFGIDRTIKAILESIRAFYDAEACVLVIPGKPGDAESYQMYRVARGIHASRSAPPEIGEEAAAQFLSPSLDYAVIYRKNRSSHTRLFDVKSRLFSETGSTSGDKLAGMLEAQRYLSVPVYYRHQAVGRLYIVDGPNRVDSSDMDFMLQFMDHVTPVMENIRLIDNLASDAAEQERRRIAHDIHDSVIQPYLGLQFGLSALDQKLEAGYTGIRENVQELLELTNHELAELRRFVWGLRATEERLDILLPAIERYAERFSKVTGIKVDVEAYGKVKVNDRLAAELFQIVAEGLSNVRRHAFCRDARVEISCKESSLLLQIKNSRPRPNQEIERGDGHDGVRTFRPHSIAERAASLGGDTQVFVDDKDYTVVSVGIPL